MTAYLTADDLLDLAQMILGKPAVLRDIGLLSSAAARPATFAFGVEAYQDVWTKAAALLHSVAMNHALLDGNKRLAWVAARTFLAINAVEPVPVDTDAAEAFMLAVVGAELAEVEEIARALFRLYQAGESA